MRLCFSRRVLARARTLSYLTERGSAEKAEYRELSPLNKVGRVKTVQLRHYEQTVFAD